MNGARNSLTSEHRFYKEINEHDGDYYRRWAASIGKNMSAMIDTVLKASEHEEQSYNSCNGILHMCDRQSRILCDEAARHCVELHTCRYTYFKKVLADVIDTGRLSTGKTYAGNALGVCAVRQFRTVRYAKASYLMSEIESVTIKGRRLDYFKKISSLSLLIIDDFGLMDLDSNSCRNLFEVLDSREGMGSTMVISQLPVSAWYEMFKDNTYADACMERIIRGAYRLNFNGKNI